MAGERKELQGLKLGYVTRKQDERSCVVEVAYQVRHPKYNKYVKRRTRYHADVPGEAVNVGDRVSVARCRPVSKQKGWRVVSVIEATKG